MLVIGLFRFSVSSWFSLGRWYASRTFKGRVGGLLGNRLNPALLRPPGCACRGGWGGWELPE